MISIITKFNMNISKYYLIKLNGVRFMELDSLIMNNSKAVLKIIMFY